MALREADFQSGHKEALSKLKQETPVENITKVALALAGVAQLVGCHSGPKRLLIQFPVRTHA